MKRACPECRVRPCAEGRELCWECLSDLFAGSRGRGETAGERLDAITLLEDLIDDREREDE